MKDTRLEIRLSSGMKADIERMARERGTTASHLLRAIFAQSQRRERMRRWER